MPLVRSATDWIEICAAFDIGDDKDMESKDREEEERSSVKGGSWILEVSAEARQGIRSGRDEYQDQQVIVVQNCRKSTGGQ